MAIGGRQDGTDPDEGRRRQGWWRKNRNNGRSDRKDGQGGPPVAAHGREKGAVGARLEGTGYPRVEGIAGGNRNVGPGKLMPVSGPLHRLMPAVGAAQHIAARPGLKGKQIEKGEKPEK